MWKVWGLKCWGYQWQGLSACFLRRKIKFETQWWLWSWEPAGLYRSPGTRGCRWYTIHVKCRKFFNIVYLAGHFLMQVKYCSIHWFTYLTCSSVGLFHWHSFDQWQSDVFACTVWILRYLREPTFTELQFWAAFTVTAAHGSVHDATELLKWRFCLTPWKERGAIALLPPHSSTYALCRVKTQWTT